MNKLIFQNLSKNSEYDCMITFKPSGTSGPSLPRTERLGINATWPLDLNNEIDKISIINGAVFDLLSIIPFENRTIKTYAYAAMVDNPDLIIIAVEILDGQDIQKK